MRSILSLSLAYCALTFASSVSAQITIAPLTTFGGGDGWISPEESTTDFLTTGNFERGLAYNPVTNHLYYVSRANNALNVRILDTTGADIGSLDVTGITGGTFALNKIAVGDDGVIYGTNLRNGGGSATFKVYRWANELPTTKPVTVFDAMPDTLTTNPPAPVAGPRLGDTLDVIGSGAATRLVAGYGPTSAPNSNGYAVIDPNASTPTTPVFSNVAFPEGTGVGQTVDGDFARGITFVSGGASGTVIGTFGGSTTSALLTDYSGTAGTARARLTLQVADERIMDFAVVGGVPLLATMEAGGNSALNPPAPLATNGTVRLYDMTDPTAPVFLASINNMTSNFDNSNQAGDLRWGLIEGNTATLYALNTNNGIQAFVVSVPEPSMAGLCGVGVLGLLGRRRRQG